MHIKYFASKLLGLIIHKNNRILVTKANYIKENVFIWGTYLHSYAKANIFLIQDAIFLTQDKHLKYNTFINFLFYFAFFQVGDKKALPKLFT